MNSNLVNHKMNLTHNMDLGRVILLSGDLKLFGNRFAIHLSLTCFVKYYPEQGHRIDPINLQPSSQPGGGNVERTVRVTSRSSS